MPGESKAKLVIKTLKKLKQKTKQRVRGRNND